tara:strand:+ start:428 stop:1429 length:1002 start_codon:yes stop_codon:yes gene_type:complete
MPEVYENRILHGGAGLYGQHLEIIKGGPKHGMIRRLDHLKPPDIYVNGIKLFESIQIQTFEFCNLKCDFCPNHYLIFDRIENKKKGIPHNQMSKKDYTKIVKNLADVQFSGRFSPYLMNEPLMDKNRMVEFIEIARQYLPKAFIQMDTNGTGLNKKLLGDMIDAGLNRIQIDDYFNDEYAIKMIEVCRNFDHDKRFFYMISSNYNVEQVKKKEDIPKYRTGEKAHYGPHTYWNRGGLVNVNPDIAVPQKDCGFPSSQMYVTWDGKALLCCCDWEYQVVHGNVLETSIEDVWSNDSYEHYRKTLKEGRRDLLKMCRKCNKDGCTSEKERGIFNE